MSIYSTIDYLHGEGSKDGHRRGILEGACRQLGKLLLRHGKRRFGPPSEQQLELVNTLADRLGRETLTKLRDRLPDAAGWEPLLAGVALPESLPATPSYVKPFQFDPTPMSASIDQYAQVPLRAGGGKNVIHLRFQRLYEPDLDAMMYLENQRLREKYKMDAVTAVLMLWPGADGPAITGRFTPPGGGVFVYNLSRIWEKDVEEMFRGPGTAMFAPLAKFDPERLPEVVRRMSELITAQAKNDDSLLNVWNLTYVCMGLRFSAERINEVLADKMPIIMRSPEIIGFKSEGYHMGHSRGQGEGAAQATLEWVLEMGSRRLGELPPDTRQALTAIRSLDRLEQLAGRVLKAATWPEALALN